MLFIHTPTSFDRPFAMWMFQGSIKEDTYLTLQCSKPPHITTSSQVQPKSRNSDSNMSDNLPVLFRHIATRYKRQGEIRQAMSIISDQLYGSDDSKAPVESDTENELMLCIDQLRRLNERLDQHIAFQKLSSEYGIIQRELVMATDDQVENFIGGAGAQWIWSCARLDESRIWSVHCRPWTLGHRSIVFGAYRDSIRRTCRGSWHAWIVLSSSMKQQNHTLNLW